MTRVARVREACLGWGCQSVGSQLTTQSCTQYQYHQKYGVYLVSISKKHDYFLIQLNKNDFKGNVLKGRSSLSSFNLFTFSISFQSSPAAHTHKSVCSQKQERNTVTSTWSASQLASQQPREQIAQCTKLQSCLFPLERFTPRYTSFSPISKPYWLF